MPALLLVVATCQSPLAEDETFLAMIEACSAVAAADSSFAFVLPAQRPMTVELNGIRIATLPLRLEGGGETADFTCGFAAGDQLAIDSVRVSGPCDNCLVEYDKDALVAANNAVAAALSRANP